MSAFENATMTGTSLTENEQLAKALDEEAQALPVESYIKREVELLSLPENDPEQSEERMRKKATSLKSGDLKNLMLHIENSKEEGDLRALALQIVSYTSLPEKIDLLLRFALTKPPVYNDERKDFFEVVLRAQAIAGLAENVSNNSKEQAIHALKNISEQTDNQYLVDRANNALARVQNQTSSPEAKEETDQLLEQQIE